MSIIDFISACRNDNLLLVRQIYDSNPHIDISYQDEEALCIACGNNNLALLIQLHEWKPDINVSARNEYCLITACKNGFINIVCKLNLIKHSIYSDISFSFVNFNSFFSIICDFCSVLMILQNKSYEFRASSKIFSITFLFLV